jgi:N-acetylglucosaminyldiphosphoundecaprenol N-acetyl-beta-D-mannosaminyltransferase
LTSLEILGCRLDLLDADAATQRIVELAERGTGEQIVTLGTEMVVYAHNHDAFRAVINACALSLCDTIGLLKVARMRGAHLKERVTGVELLDRLCAVAAQRHIPVYFLGGAPGVAADAAAILEVRFPGLIVAGMRNGYFSDDEAADVARDVADSGARLLFAGMGSPRQELWLSEHLRETGCGAGIGVGGSLDVISGRVTRAPEFARRLNLEWLYRLVTEPRRWRRQLALPRFVWLVAREQLRA